MRSLLRFSLLILLLTFVGCNELKEIVGTASPHQQYANQLERAGLHDSAAGQAWTRASQTALDSTVQLHLPAAETAFFDPQQPDAVGYRLTPEQGEEMRIVIETPDQTTDRIFADLFELIDNESPNHITGSEAPDTLSVEASGNAYLLRLQPELFGGGQVDITIQTAPTLAFPVEGRDGTAIRSFFGDSRDGGARQHQGVDIFAPRGTPVLAAASGVVRRTTPDQGLGGKTVWVTNPTTRTSYYYAHLDTVMVSAPSRVARGDTLGLVGNTGNARHTPPHLHFEVRSGGPRNPLPYINTPRQEPPAITASTSSLGNWMRTTGTANLRQGPSTGTPVQHTLSAGTPLLVTGSTSGWHRVTTPYGRQAYIAANLVESAEARAHGTATEQAVVRYRPDPNAPAIASISNDQGISVLGSFQDYLLVQVPGGRTGWLQR